MDFPTNIKTLRANHGLTQRLVAESIGITIRSYQYYEKGEQQPTLTTLKKFAQFFDVSFDYLIGFSDIKKPKEVNKLEEIIKLPTGKKDKRGLDLYAGDIIMNEQQTKLLMAYLLRILDLLHKTLCFPF